MNSISRVGYSTFSPFLTRFIIREKLFAKELAEKVEKETIMVKL